MTGLQRAMLRVGSQAMLLAIAAWTIALCGALAGAWRVRGVWAFYFIATVIGVALTTQWTSAVRQRFIREAPLPRFLQRKLRETYPHLSPRDRKSTRLNSSH